MDIKKFMIDGKPYDLTQVAQYLALGDKENARFALGLMTGLSDEKCEQYLDSIRSLVESSVADFKAYPINGNTYNVEPLMELLSKGDVMGSYHSLKQMGFDDDTCKNCISKLNGMIDEYNKIKESENSDVEFEEIKKRELDPNWFAPPRCPNCGEVMEWTPQGHAKGGFSGGKAIAGTVLLGPLGAAAGALGKGQTQYQCAKCGFTQGYSKGSKRMEGILNQFK